MKCYSKPDATGIKDTATKTAIDHKIDEAFEKAYRNIYMGQDSEAERRQASYDAYMERKRQAWKEGGA